MSNFYQLISKIKRRPSMYLGKPAISNLRSFLSGYILARRELDIPQTQEEKEFSEFQFWIKSKFKISSDQSWDKTILFFSEDEQSAIAHFFNLFDEFVGSEIDKSHRGLERVQPDLLSEPTTDPDIPSIEKKPRLSLKDLSDMRVVVPDVEKKTV
ncbi:hypothetical protein JOY44_00740 [Phormidium sp. CLA17]|uniref:hypothetical protein n=1 Tax=Leptolyngbya sp. Cla-17 TaxID=2803751 RepID=UPI0018D68348|nr:hypothetical protein [Leptolyngbya sp. Cla-17]MBM0740182.1 hypothetical protein [Leptolyngbya sp. Cla-17]